MDYFNYKLQKDSFFYDPQISTNESVLEILNKLNSFIIKERQLPFIQTRLVDKYFSLWIEVFSKHPYDAVSERLDSYFKDLYSNKISYETFPYPIIYDNNKLLYSVFDIEYIKLIKTSLPFKKYSDICHLLDYDDEPDNIKYYTKSCLSNGDLVAVESKYSSTPLNIIDGNHRLYFVKREKILNYKIRIIPFDYLNENMFINKFNFSVYLFYNKINDFLILENNLCQQHKEYKKCKNYLNNFNLL